MLSAILVPVLAVSLLVAAENGCTSHQFTCKDGECIEGTLKCDGVKNCKDGSDEIFNTCYNTTCNDGDYFRCNYGGCMDIKVQCNGIDDCSDGSDENKFLCAQDEQFDKVLADVQGNCEIPYELECKEGGKCLLGSQLCDGSNDCPKGDDESAKICGSSICPADSFRCQYGACISSKKFCDHEIDCADGSDEKPDICFKEQNLDRNVLEDNENYETEINHHFWNTNTCPLKLKTGMQVTDYFSDFTFRADAEVPDKTVVSVTCDSGYVILGPSIYKCDNMQWLTDWNVDCVRICDQSASVRNVGYSTQCFYTGNLVDCQQNTQLLNTNILVTCATGYETNTVLYPGNHSCNEHGNWSVETENPSCEPICGIKSPAHPDITPWTVSIFKRNSISDLDYSFNCLGSILSPYIVITSKECFTDKRSKYSDLNYTIVEGHHTFKFNLDEDHGYVLHNISKTHIVTYHIQYKAAILTVVKPFRFGALVRPICLTAEQAIAEDTQWKIYSPNAGKQQLGEGVAYYNANKYTLTHIVANISTYYDIKAFVEPIRNDIAKSERSL